MNTVIVTPDLIGPIRNGGIGTFATNLAFLLRQSGSNVTILFTSPMENLSDEWYQDYTARGIKIISLFENRRLVTGDLLFMRLSEKVNEYLPADTDVVYFQDWQANGLHTVRMGRVAPAHRPLYVTTLHGSTEWIHEGMQQHLPPGASMLNLCYGERYAVEHSDFVVSPSQYMINWVLRQGWRLPESPHRAVLGLPYLAPLIASKPILTQPYREIIFFGRLETRKGIDLFVEGLTTLARRDPTVLTSIETIILLGKPGEHRYGDTSALAHHLEDETGLRVELYTQLDALQARKLLIRLADSALVIFPSLSDNFPYAILEASLIPNLNFIASNAGGIPELVGERGANCLFAPFPSPFIAKLTEYLQRGHILSDGGYDGQTANQRWLDFHHSLVLINTTRFWTSAPVVPNHRIDVCIPYFNHGKYLPGLLTLLEKQTWTAFDVYVVNDGSTDPESQRVFQDLMMANTHPNWHFIHQINSGASSARNYAASLGQSDYLLFVDSDNLPLSTMIEQLIHALEAAQADCVTCYFAAYESAHLPNPLRQPLIEKRPLYVYKPIGNFTEAGLFHNGFGDTNFIIRRTVFRALNGFSTQPPEYRFLGNEDYEFLARLSLAGYELEVMPQVLYYYRHLLDSVQRSSSPYGNAMRVQQVYKERLQEIGLGFLAPYVWGLSIQSQTANHYTDIQHDPVWVAHHIPWYILRDAVIEKLAKHLRRIFRWL